MDETGEILFKDTGIETPNFSIDRLPTFRIKSVRITNLKSFEDCYLDFLDNKFVCFIGPNGTGKSTSLEIIQLICSRFEGTDLLRLNAYLGKSVRQTKGRKLGITSEDDFMLTADIESEYGNYQIQLTKSGFVKDHPIEIKDILYRLCYFSSLDKELHKFQLKKEKWDIFKELFETITGYEITKEDAIVKLSEMIGSYGFENEEEDSHIWSFWVNKKHEIVAHKDCSDGERKVIKSLASLLNLDYPPRIILIDNIEMHVEAKRHLPLVQSLKKAFPDSQIFSTTHSIPISKNFKMQKEIYDLRWIHASDLLKSEPWRIHVSDVVDEYITKASCLSDDLKSKRLVESGIYMKNNLLQNPVITGLVDSVKNFVKEVEEEFLNDMLDLKSDGKIVNFAKNQTI